MSNSEELNIMKIREEVEHDTFNINEAASKAAKQEVRELIENYVPNKSKTTNIETRIV